MKESSTRRTMKLALVAIAITAMGCDGPPSVDPDGGSQPPQGRGTISGTLRPFSSGTAAAPATSDEGLAMRAAAGVREHGARVRRQGVADLQRSGALPPDVSHFIEGEIVVGVNGDVQDVVDRLHEHQGLDLYRFEVAAWGGPSVLAVRIRDAREQDRPIRRAETLYVRGLLMNHPSLRYAEPNYVRQALRRPDDAAYRYQWHYEAMNLPAAWDVTTGSSSVVVAVLDDGCCNNHPQLQSRAIPGRDMVSDAASAGDGDGRDGNSDQVPNPAGSWHGVHVAGTIGAVTNDGQSVGGTDWACRLLPVRVLDKDGSGSSLDIIAGIYWAAGIDVPGEPRNPTPARILNMSLGGGTPSAAEQEAVNAVVATNATIVVAAGNRNQDAGGTSYSAYDNVIVVGATDLRGARAPYSNFGASIDVMAPGGDTSVDLNGDEIPDGVISTFLDPTGTSFWVEALDGTSMASPHVAGLASLMVAANPSITPATIERIMRETAEGSSRCAEGCGTGLVNAGAAVRAAAGATAPSSPARLSVSSGELRLAEANQGTVLVFNEGGTAFDFTASLSGAAAGSLTLLSGASGTVGPGGSAAVVLDVSRAGLADGSYAASLRIASAAGSADVPVSFRVGAAASVNVGTIVVGAVAFDPITDELIVGGSTETDASRGYRFSFDCDAGEWIVVAFNDPNGNGELDEGELFGVYPTRDAITLVPVGPGGRVDAVDFALIPVLGGGPSGPSDPPAMTGCDPSGGSTRESAIALAAGASRMARICGGEEDWYRVSGSGSISVRISFDHAMGDLDMEALSESGTLLGSSTGVTGEESVTAIAPFFVRVYGYGGVANSYTITAN